MVGRSYGARRVIGVLALLLAALLLSPPLAAAGPAPGDDDGTRIEPQIWNGRTVKPGKRRNVALVDFPGDGFVGGCTATLIRRKWLLTAGHCIEDVPGQRLTIRMGGTRSDGTFEEVFTTRNHGPHPKYNWRTLEYDFGLIKLPSRSNMPRAKLATFDDHAGWQPGVQATIVGWGGVDSHGSGLGVLRVGRTELASDADCRSRWGSDYDRSSMLCGFGITSDTCQGDSGGPLFVPSSSGTLLMGVTSWGGNCTKSRLGVYGWVPAGQGWVERVVARGRL